jgi:hypothetical protein
MDRFSARFAWDCNLAHASVWVGEYDLGFISVSFPIVTVRSMGGEIVEAKRENRYYPVFSN